MSDFLSFLADNPTLRLLQFLLLSIAVLAVFFVLFTTRDILLRSKSFLFQVISILLVACVPVIGFFLYLLIRPARTLRQKELERNIEEMTKKLAAPGSKESSTQRPESREKPKTGKTGNG